MVSGWRSAAVVVRVETWSSSGAVGALSALWLAGGRVSRPGASGLASLVDPVPFLAELRRRGVRAAVFQGDATERDVEQG